MNDSERELLDGLEAELKLCKNCNCMTHMIKDKCGKCGAKKEEKVI